MDKYSLSFLIFPKGDTMNKYALLLALPLTAAGIAGCASDIDSNYYSTGSVGQVSQAQGCTVVPSARLRFQPKTAPERLSAALPAVLPVRRSAAATRRICWGRSAVPFSAVLQAMRHRKG